MTQKNVQKILAELVRRTTAVAKLVVARIKKLKFIEVFFILTLVFVWLVLMRFFHFNDSWEFIRVEVVASDWKSTGNIYSSKAPFWLSEALEVGMSERNFYGRKTAEIVEIENYERGGQEAQIYLIIKILTEKNERNGQKFFNGFPLLVGEKIEFSFETARVPGNILDVNYPRQGYDQKEFEVEGVQYFVDPWQIDQVKIGDTMINRSSGEVVAEVLTLSTAPTRKRVIDLDSSQQELATVSDNNKQDLRLKIKLKAQLIDGRWYFAGHQRLRVGEKLWIYTDDANINALEIQELLPI